MSLISEEEAMVRLLLYVRRKYRTQKKAAAAWGISQTYLTGMVRGSKNITGKAAEELGIRRVTAYETAEQDHP